MDYYCLRALEMTPRLLEREIRRIGPSGWDARPHPDRFTPREDVCHLADWEPIMLTRIKVGVETPGGAIVAYDEGVIAIEHDYASKDPLAEAANFKADRAKTIEYIKSLKPEDFEKTVEHPERGTTKVNDLITMLVAHDVYHIEHMAFIDSGKVVDTW
ncbi:MAG: DinB family protein [Fimbriimonadales bacterium]